MRAHFFARKAGQKNRAFRSKSSEAPMRFLWAFRSNPIAQAAAPNQATRIIAEGNYVFITMRRQFAEQIAHKGSSKNIHFVIPNSKGKNCCENSSFFLCVLPAMESF
jgi:uncharacterized lipoprotein YbaY